MERGLERKRSDAGRWKARRHTSVAALLIAIVVLASGCNAPAAPPFRTVADVKLLMQSVTDPAADVVWGSVGTIISRDGVEEIAPRTLDEWTAVRNSAVVLAESGNLLMIVPRAKDGGDWMMMSRALIDSATAAIRASEARDKGAIFTIGGEIYQTCVNCHQQYMDAIVNANE